MIKVPYMLEVFSLILLVSFYPLRADAYRMKNFLTGVVAGPWGRVTRRPIQMSVEALSPVRVRFAPSPTGSLHVGGARTALFNWLLAKKSNGAFIIRVEDTDEARSSRESEKSILTDLKWLGMDWNEGPVLEEELQVGEYGPYRQSERKEFYIECAENLIERGLAYRCFCTEDELEVKRDKAQAEGKAVVYDGTWRDADPEKIQERLNAGDPFTVRFLVPKGALITINDLVRGEVTWDAEATVGDFIILRSNGMPVYNFCVAVDDARMKITHVIRAEEHLTNTLRQMLVLNALEYTAPTYAHVSLILGSDRSKLSKRHGATSVQQFSEQGFLPSAMVNYLAKLGWNDGTDKEIYQPDEIIEAFDLTRVISSPAVFDIDKLKWINAQHIKLLPINKLQSLVATALKTSDARLDYKKSPILGSNGCIEENNFVEIISKNTREKLNVITDARDFTSEILKYELESSIMEDKAALTLLNQEIIFKIITDYDEGTFPQGNGTEFPSAWKAYVNTIGKELNLKGKALFQPLRLALTGRMSGPDVGEQLQIISYAPHVIHPDTKDIFVPLHDRVETLRSFAAATD